MSLKDARNRTYIAGTTPVSGGDMNEIQDQIIELWSAEFSLDLLLSDHFTGSAVDTGKWKIVSGAPTKFDDSASGGRGTVKFTATGTDQVIGADSDLAIGTKDFRMATLLRISSMAATNGISLDTGLNVAGNGAKASIVATGASAHWFASHDFVTPGTFVQYDLGVAYGTATYDLVEIRRVAGVYQWLVNGVPKLTATPTAIPAGYLGNPRLAAIHPTSGTNEMIVDLSSYWAQR